MTENERSKGTREGETVRYRAGPGESLSGAVIAAVAACSRRAPVAGDSPGEGGEPLDPLCEAIDPDALDALFAPVSGEERSEGTVRFTYCDHDVAVESAGVITVRPR